MWKNLLLQNEVGMGDLGPLSTLGPSKILKLELKKWDKKVRPLKLKKIMQTPNSSWESIEILKDFIVE